jgi:hypothetical protein
MVTQNHVEHRVFKMNIHNIHLNIRQRRVNIGGDIAQIGQFLKRGVKAKFRGEMQNLEWGSIEVGSLPKIQAENPVAFQGEAAWANPPGCSVGCAGHESAKASTAAGTGHPVAQIQEGEQAKKGHP